MLAGACGRSDTIATLASAQGPVERQHAEPGWKAAAVGAKFVLGDAARTADGGAGLDLTGGASIAMLPHTVLRFGGDPSAQKISVELGAIDLSGTGAYGLDIGQVSLTDNSKIRITATGAGKSSIELSVGAAQISAGGKTLSLTIGKSLEVGGGLELGAASIVSAPVDAGVVDAAVLPPDAPELATGSGAQVEVIGGKAETQAPDAKDWKPLAAGTGQLPAGTKLRVGAGTTAKLTAKGATLEMATGARASVGEDLALVLDAGSGKASVPVAGGGGVAVPSGNVALTGTAQTPAEVRVDVGGRETKVSVLRGQAKLTGGGGTLDMNRGESASIARSNGAIHPIEAIPTYFDFRVAVGDSLTVHDPRPPTAVQFQFLGKCPGDGVIELDHDGNFRTAKQSAGKDNANLMVGPGNWAYRLRCTQGDNEGKQVAAGRIYVQRDDGRRPLPKQPNLNPVDADGRIWRLSYQSLVPNVEVHYKGAGSGNAYRLHLAQGGKDQVFDGTTDKIVVPGAGLKEGTYTYWFDRDGVKQDKISTLKIDFDQTAPQVYIELPLNGTPFPATIDVKGAVLQGWSAAVEGVDVPIDKQRRFTASVQPPPGQALAIRLSHPQRGVHYYLRRAK